MVEPVYHKEKIMNIDLEIDCEKLGKLLTKRVKCPSVTCLFLPISFIVSAALINCQRCTWSVVRPEDATETGKFHCDRRKCVSHVAPPTDWIAYGGQEDY